MFTENKKLINKKLFRFCLVLFAKKNTKCLLGLFLSFVFIIIHKKEVFSTNKINLAISLDINFIYPSIVFLTSLLYNRANSTIYKIHILTDNSIKKDSMNKINSIFKRFGKNYVEFKYFNLEGNFKGASTKHFPFSSYYRIALPTILPEVDKIIYIDTDVINFEDLSEMYSIKFKDNMFFCGTLDSISLLNELRKFQIQTDKYINAGILLINLKALRKNGIEKKIRDFIPNRDLPTADQTAINAICHNNIQILSYKYAIFALDSVEQLININNQQNIMYRFNESLLKKAFNEPILFHYYTRRKPWKKFNHSFNRVYWWYYAKISGFYKEILDYYEFKINDIESLLKQIPEDGGLLKRNYKKLILNNNLSNI